MRSKSIIRSKLPWFLAFIFFAANTAPGQLTSSGRLFIHGGGGVDGTIQTFVERAGGKTAKLVVIPTATSDDNLPSQEEMERLWRKRGIGSLTVLHTRDRSIADSQEFIASIKAADAVFINGGDQQRLANAYVGTRTETALVELLNRGGVIGGTSAGAAIMSRVMIGHGRRVPYLSSGFDFLPSTVVDQHFLNRSRINRLMKAAQTSKRVGVGIDERTCLIITDNNARVEGEGYVTLIDGTNSEMRFETYADGDSFELSKVGMTERSSLELTDMTVTGIDQLASSGRPLEVFVPESVDAALKLRRQLLKDEDNESEARALQRLAIKFAEAYEKFRQESQSPTLFDFSGVDFESAIRGARKGPTADQAYGAFTGKWYGRWEQRDVDHHWSRVIQPGELAFATKHPQFQVGWQYAWIGDGYGINHCLSFEDPDGIKRFLLGYTEHLEAGDFNKIVARRPHVGIYAGPGKLIWITAREVFFEEAFSNPASGSRYSIIGFSYSKSDLGNEGIRLEVKDAFVTEYSKSSEDRVPFRRFKSSISVKSK